MRAPLAAPRTKRPVSPATDLELLPFILWSAIRCSRLAFQREAAGRRSSAQALANAARRRLDQAIPLLRRVIVPHLRAAGVPGTARVSEAEMLHATLRAITFHATSTSNLPFDQTTDLADISAWVKSIVETELVAALQSTTAQRNSQARVRHAMTTRRRAGAASPDDRREIVGWAGDFATPPDATEPFPATREQVVEEPARHTPRWKKFVRRALRALRVSAC